MICNALSIIRNMIPGAAIVIILIGLFSIPVYAENNNSVTYPIIETGQTDCYDTLNQITCPTEGESFYGQDGHYSATPAAYIDNGDGTVSDLNTGLMWQKTPALYDKSTYTEASTGADTFNLAGYTDWRLPTIKELYSLIDFNGSTYYEIPYLDTGYFDFRFGDTTLGERFIDAQYWSSTEYLGTTMNGDFTVFGVNFGDGRIKGYPAEPVGPPGSEIEMESFVRYVRGPSDYGQNSFVDNGDGTITDLATGLMWQKTDDGVGRKWEDALAYAEGLSLAGYDDWRLPNAKELQSIANYLCAPDASDPDQIGPAIDTIFDITNIGSEQDPDYGYYWTGTTHLDGPDADYAVYISFGCAWGWMETPPGSGSYTFTNVHGAGAQRSDPKTGDPAGYPIGHGPQGDEVRIYNMVRAVRDVTQEASSCGDANSDGNVNVSDAVSIINYVFTNGNPPDPLWTGDCNCDGDCNVSDAVWIINFVFVNGNEPCDTDGDSISDC